MVFNEYVFMYKKTKKKVRKESEKSVSKVVFVT